MKIIKNNITNEKETNSNFPIKAMCEHCGSEIELEERDVEVGVLGLYEFVCPCCSKTSCVDDGIELTSENLEFPKHYYNFSYGKNVSNEKINQYVKECIDVLRNSDEEDFYYIRTGNVYVGVRRFDGDEEFCITVAKGYYEVDIPYTEQDKEKWCK